MKNKPWPIGRTVKTVRLMTHAELEREGWEDEESGGMVVEFDDGSAIYASRDGEGNSPGELFGASPDGLGICVAPVSAS